LKEEENNEKVGGVKKKKKRKKGKKSHVTEVGKKSQSSVCRGKGINRGEPKRQKKTSCLQHRQKDPRGGVQGNACKLQKRMGGPSNRPHWGQTAHEGIRRFHHVFKSRKELI